MPRYYCDYCDAYLTHDSYTVRKQHNQGWKHKSNVREFYAQFLDTPLGGPRPPNAPPLPSTPRPPVPPPRPMMGMPMMAPQPYNPMMAAGPRPPMQYGAYAQYQYQGMRPPQYAAPQYGQQQQQPPPGAYGATPPGMSRPPGISAPPGISQNR